MPRLVHQPPKYSKHKASGQAVVCIGGEDVYLGAYGSRASRQKYDQVVAEWLTTGRSARPKALTKTQSPSGDVLSIAHLIVRFWRHARTYYRDGGSVGGEAFNYRDALRPVLKLYSRTPAADFGPVKLKTVRDQMIRDNWSRNYINRQILRIKSVFRWAAENELLPATVYESLRTVAGLRAGKTDARETAPVKPVALSHAEIIFSFLSPQVQGMVELQALTGISIPRARRGSSGRCRTRPPITGTRASSTWARRLVRSWRSF